MQHKLNFYLIFLKDLVYNELVAPKLAVLGISHTYK